MISVMTADEWLRCENPLRMLKALSDPASGRKLRLIACAICRLVWKHCSPSGRAAVEAVERYVDGLVTEAEMMACGHAVIDPVTDTAFDSLSERYDDPAYFATQAVRGLTVLVPLSAAFYALRWAELAPRAAAPVGKKSHAAAAFRAAVCDRIREIIGPLSHPLVLMSAPMLREYGGPAALFRSRISSTACALAEGITADQAFDRLPILADALEDAGLDDRLLLDHLRYGIDHVRGCWALDLVLGKG
jgi:hypothetical protein